MSSLFQEINSTAAIFYQQLVQSILLWVLERELKSNSIREGLTLKEALFNTGLIFYPTLNAEIVRDE